MIMNKLLIDYCKSRLDDSNYKPEYKEVANASFAKFIVDVAACIDDIRECDLLPFGTTNYEYEYKINWTFASEYSFIKRLIYTFDRVYGT